MKAFITGLLLLAASLSQAETILIKTSKGDMTAELFTEKSPISVKNFLSYVDSGFYNGVIFHRVIDGFMIQTGGFGADMKRKPAMAPITNESNNYLMNKRGTLAMARTGDPNSATSQFFINHKHNTSLNYTFGRPGYAVFGQLTSGLDILDTIAKAPTTSRAGYQDVPVDPITIFSITRVEASEPTE